MRLHWVSHGFHSFKTEGVLETIQTPYGTEGETKIQLGKGQGQGQSKLGADPELEPKLLNICPKLFLHWHGSREEEANQTLI